MGTNIKGIMLAGFICGIQPAFADPIDKDKAGDDGCALAAAATLAGYTNDDKFGQWLSDCSRHPEKSICEATRSFVEENGKSFPAGFVCRGAD